MSWYRSNIQILVSISIGVCVWMDLFSPAQAQIALPEGYPHQCQLTNQEVFIALRGGIETLVLEAKYVFQSKKDTYGRPLVPEAEDFVPDPPASMGWVVPVPSDASSAEVVSENLMQDLYDLTHPSTKEKYRLRTGRPQGITRFGGSIFTGGSDGEEGALKWKMFLTPETAIEETVAYLSEGGLKLPEGVLLEDYAKAGMGFAVGILENPAIGGVLGPFTAQFRSDRAVFPLRFQSHAGPFALSIYALSDKVLDHRALSKWNLRGNNAWENLHREAWFRGYTALADIPLPESLSAFVRSLGVEENSGDFSFYAWEGKDYNSYGRTTEKFKEDFSILVR